MESFSRALVDHASCDLEKLLAQPQNLFVQPQNLLGPSHNLLVPDDWRRVLLNQEYCNFIN